MCTFCDAGHFDRCFHYGSRFGQPRRCRGRVCAILSQLCQAHVALLDSMAIEEEFAVEISDEDAECVSTSILVLHTSLTSLCSKITSVGEAIDYIAKTPEGEQVFSIAHHKA